MIPSRATIAARLRSPWFLAMGSALSAVLAFPSFGLSFFAPVSAFFLVWLILEAPSAKPAFWFGCLAAFLMVLGGGYWIGYVLHEFGELPWVAAIPLFLLICGFEAFNIPIFIVASTWLAKRLKLHSAPSPWRELWYALALPALFVITEYLVPKIFPWYLGHAFFSHPLWIQISEITGAIFLSFVAVSLGSTAAFYFFQRIQKQPVRPWIWFVPAGLVAFVLAFGAFRLSEPVTGIPFRALLIQANIGNFEKVAAEKGSGEVINHVFNTYEQLTEKALASWGGASPQLIVWPESALPVFLNDDQQYRVRELKQRVSSWKIPLLTGGFSRAGSWTEEFNSAYLFTPQANGTITVQSYQKNILLAFGEYMPFGDWFPALYRYFPQVSHFGRGTTQEPLQIADSPFGITICYEAVVPTFFKKVMSHPVKAVINLTNDSWFGPTNEPFFHGGLTAFRAVENRIPFLRTANTGISFFIDDRGRIHQPTEVFETGSVRAEVELPESAPHTFYAQFGDWFVALAGLLFGGLCWRLRTRQKKNTKSERRPKPKPIKQTPSRDKKAASAS